MYMVKNKSKEMGKIMTLKLLHENPFKQRDT